MLGLRVKDRFGVSVRVRVRHRLGLWFRVRIIIPYGKLVMYGHKMTVRLSTVLKNI